MTETTVPPAKPAGELEPGEHVIASDLDNRAEGIARVLLSTPFGTLAQDTMVIVSYGDRFPPESYPLPIDKMVTLASAEAVAEREAAERRQRAADVLRQLARLIVDKRLPLPGLYQGFGVTMNFGRDVALVERIGAELGLPVRDSYGTTSVEWPSGQEPGGLTVSWTAYSPKKAEPNSAPAVEPDPDPTGLLHSRADDADDPTPVSPARVPLHTGGVVDGGQLVDETPAHFLQPAPLAAHYEAVDRPGEVECACGEVFAADTTAEAGVLLQAHARELNVPAPLVHMGTAVGGTACGRPVAAAERVSLVWLYVTCRACIDGPEATPPLHTVARAADTVPVPAEDATVTQLPSIDPDSSMEAHYDAETETGIFSPARRQELLWKRAVGSFGSRSAALADAHGWALLEDNDRAKALVEAWMTPEDEGRITNPNLARFMAVREDRRRSAERKAALQRAKETYA